MFQLEIRDATNIDFNEMDLNVELTSLNDSYDGALVWFEYGEQPDLSDGQLTDRTGILYLNNNGTKGISGLSEDTTYYFKSYGQSVAFTSVTMMEDAFDSLGFTDVLTNDETKFIECNQSETAMGVAEYKIFAIPSSLQVWLLSPHIITAMWNNEPGYTSFWQSGTPDLPQSNATYLRNSEEIWADGNYDLYIDNDGSLVYYNNDDSDNYLGSGGGEWAIFYDLPTVDLSGVDNFELQVKYDDIDDGTSPQIAIFINDNIIWESGTSGFDWQNINIDVSGYSGDNVISFGKTHGGTGFDEQTYYFKEIKLG